MFFSRGKKDKTSGNASKVFKSFNYFLHDDTTAAVRELKDIAANSSSEHLDTYLTLGTILRKKGDFLRAIQIHESLLSRNTANRDEITPVIEELIASYVSVGSAQKAIHYIHMLAHEHNTEKYLKLLASLHMQQEDFDHATKYLGKLYKQNEAKYGKILSYCYVLKAMKNEHTIQKDLYAALKYYPNNHKGLFLLAEEYQKTGKKSKLFQTLETILKNELVYSASDMDYIYEMYTIHNKQDELYQLVSELNSKEEVKNPFYAVWLAEYYNEKNTEESRVKSLSTLKDFITHKKVSTIVAKKYGELSMDDVLVKYAEKKAPYICAKCGATYALYAFQCASCKDYEVIAPH